MRRRRQGNGPATPPARTVILPPIGWLAGCGTPAAHHRFPEQLIETHLGRPRTTTDTTARITVAAAMATITARPFHDADRSVARPCAPASV